LKKCNPKFSGFGLARILKNVPGFSGFHNFSFKGFEKDFYPFKFLYFLSEKFLDIKKKTFKKRKGF